jgi:hypothetical protein
MRVSLDCAADVLLRTDGKVSVMHNGMARRTIDRDPQSKSFVSAKAEPFESFAERA